MIRKPLTDEAHRQQALDISSSFIVQAPAGSGKTELLTLRFLKLLATCDQPEQVLAITFTRKAANEMSRRIMDALRWAQSCTSEQIAGSSEFQQQRFTIASEVLVQDNRQNWQLLQNPTRLRVQTIDSFCFYLASQLPVLSRLGGNPQVSDDVTSCFVDAISNTLAQLETGSAISDDIAALLAHLDNDIGKIERLLVGLLHKRDQWLSHILFINSAFTDARIYLQQSLAELVAESIAEARAGLKHYAAQLIPLLNFAAANRLETGTLPMAEFMPLSALPEQSPAAIPCWQFLVETLLTKKSGINDEPAWRRQVTVNNGFPPGNKSDKAHQELCKQQKAAMTALLQSLADDQDLLVALDYLRILPDPALTTESWQFLAALTRVLAHLGSELLLSYHKFRVIDYTQASSAARTALGDEDSPTDLALALDHHIQHVLVDEFQDTSQMQLDILRQITAGWEPGDGRTLFLVGDAMQSCYAFRNANVGIYLHVSANGLGNIPLKLLTLGTNFRSQETLVAWVNQVFASAFPQQANISRGAVPYIQSASVHEVLPDQRIRVSLLTHAPEQQDFARQQEADEVVAHIRQLQAQYPEQSIAVLVRARPHLNHIIPALRAASIRWHSTDIDRLTALPVIEDLLSLTRAVLNEADRLAWLALLRAPWCGLRIDDLYAISSCIGNASIWHTLQNIDDVPDLSEDAKERLRGIIPVLQFAMANRTRISLRVLLEQCWQLLGIVGISRAEKAMALELESVAHFLNIVSEHEVGFGLPDVDQFYDAVAATFVPNSTAEDESGEERSGPSPIHLLTMHKAKGLEFDHVLLPGLARPTKSDDKPLLQWHERLNQSGNSRLFLATLSPSGSTADPLYELLRYEQHYKSTLENTRLLYIAVTRARASVRLFATLKRSKSGELKPEQASLLARIWRELSAQPQLVEEQMLPESAMSGSDAAPRSHPPKNYPPKNHADYPQLTPIRRLKKPLQLDTERLQGLSAAVTDSIEPDEANAPDAFTLQTDALVGTVIHRSLEAIGRSGNFVLDPARLTALRHTWQLQLRDLVEASALPEYLQQVEIGVCGTLQNPSLQWLFAPEQHRDELEAGYEVAITRRGDFGVQHFRIDRSFIDSTGTRWIIDYKTSVPAQAQTETDFISEQRVLYTQQLHAYKELFAQIESRPVKCALLFTSLGKLVELY